MKKVLMVFICLVMFAPIMNVKADNKDVTIYLFRGNTCNHCEEALDYISKNQDVFEDFKFVTYEVWKNNNNASLHKEVATRLEIPKDDLTSVPCFIVGNKYMVGYRNAETLSSVLELAREEAKRDDYKDVVEETRKSLNLKVEALTLKDLFPEASSTATIIVFAVFGLVILGIIGLIVFSRNN